MIFVCTMTAIVGATTLTALAQHGIRESSRMSAPPNGQSIDRHRMDIDWGYSRRLSGKATDFARAQYPNSLSDAISGSIVQGGQNVERETKAFDTPLDQISQPIIP